MIAKLQFLNIEGFKSRGMDLGSCMDLPGRRKQNRCYRQTKVGRKRMGMPVVGRRWNGGRKCKERWLELAAHLGGCLQTVLWKLVESVKVILMRTPSNRKYKTSTDHHLSLTRPPLVELGWLRWSIEILKEHRLMLRQKITLPKLTVGPLLLKKIH